MKPLNRLPAKIGLCLALLLIGSCIGARTARADVEPMPKPEPRMDFNFVYETDSELTVVEGVLQKCSDSTCIEAWAIEAREPGFNCTSTHCSLMGHGDEYGNIYYRLVITFSDGVTRQSNSFTQEHYEAGYSVTVRENDLWVEETSKGGLAGLLLFAMLAIIAGAAGLIVCGAPLFFALSVVMVAFIAKGGQGQVRFETSRALFVAAWIVMLPFFVVGSLFSLALPLIVVIEGVMAFVYAARYERPRFTLLTLVTLANAISQPILWLVLFLAGDVSLAYLVLGECFIWLLEAALLYLWQRETFSFKQILGLSLLLNAVSFVIGLLLPL